MATSLRVRPLQIRVDPGPLSIDGDDLNDDTLDLTLRLPAPDALLEGDLLRLHLERASGETYHHYVRVGEIEVEQTIPAVQLFGIPVIARPAEGGRLFRTDLATVVPDSVAQMTPSGWVPLPFTAGDYSWSVLSGGDTYRLTMPLLPPESEIKIEVGDLLRIEDPAGAQPVFFTAERVQRGDPGGAGTMRLVLDSDSPLRVEDSAASEPHELTQVDVLSFDLTIREGETSMEHWPDLRFSPEIDYWWDVLQPAIASDQVDPAAFTVDDFTGRSLRLGAAIDAADPMPIPIGMGAVPFYQGSQDEPLITGKDGLDSYDPVQLFIDDDFETVGVRSLLALVNDLLHLASQPRRLLGMHSLIPVDEVAMIALPDLAHIGWGELDSPVFSEPEEEPAEPKEPTGFHDCPEEPVVEEDCAAPVVMLDPAGSGTDPSSQAWLQYLPEQSPEADHDDAAMLTVQRALIRLCAARADVVGLLSLPQHYNVQAASQWHQEMTTTPEFFDRDPLSYAVLYHGWPAIREQTAPSLAPLRYLPPDGFMAGMMAAREIQRGAWIAPANVDLQDVVDLKPNFGDDRWALLFQRQMNILRQKPGRYTLLSAMTLARDRSLRQINVRRLLILLRKLALREGQRYVFETNNERFRSLVQTYFENILTQIQERGGLQAFQVVTNEEINTKNDYDNGRFLIALKVAPTLPIEFITITMLRSGADAITIFER